jgi:hypothetical protein
MKKTIFLLLILHCSLFIAYGQAPHTFKYQTVVRDNSGNLITEQTVYFRISILKSNSSGTVTYSEEQQIQTNQFGLANLNIGSGTNKQGSISVIDWGGDVYFIKVEYKQSLAGSYEVIGTSQLLSVPYALYANKAQSSGPEGTSGQTLRNNGSSWEANSLLYNDGQKIGIGTNAPISLIHLKNGTEPEVTLSNDSTTSNDYISNSRRGLHIGSNARYSESTKSYSINTFSDPSFMQRFNHKQGAGGWEFMTRAGNGSGLNVALRLSEDSKVIIPNELNIYDKIRISSGSPALNKVLISDALGYGSWGNVPIGGSNGNVLFNNNNVIGGDAGLFWDNTNKRLGVGKATPGYALDVTGTVNITDKVVKASTTGATHNLLPIAYGNISAAGGFNAGSDNFSCAWTGSYYQIIISGESYGDSDYVTNVTIASLSSAVVAKAYSSIGRLTVYFYDNSGNPVQSPFMFVTYKP